MFKVYVRISGKAQAAHLSGVVREIREGATQYREVATVPHVYGDITFHWATVFSTPRAIGHEWDAGYPRYRLGERALGPQWRRR